MKFAAQTAGVTTQMQVRHMADMRDQQNKLAQTGGADVTVPQFSQPGLKTGPGPNEAIQQMAGKQLQANAQGGYNHCVGQAAGACGNMTKGGGRRTRRHTRRRSRKRRSRKKKVKNQQK
jgi:hypothetical protein